ATPAPATPAPAAPAPAAPAPAAPAAEGSAAPPAPDDARSAGTVVAGSEADVLPAGGEAKTGIPIGQRPLGYLKRLLEYYISHEKGFVAVQRGCQETVRVEMYPLMDG